MFNKVIPGSNCIREKTVHVSVWFTYYFIISLDTISGWLQQWSVWGIVEGGVGCGVGGQNKRSLNLQFRNQPKIVAGVKMKIERPTSLT